MMIPRMIQRFLFMHPPFPEFLFWIKNEKNIKYKYKKWYTIESHMKNFPLTFALHQKKMSESVIFWKWKKSSAQHFSFSVKRVKRLIINQKNLLVGIDKSSLSLSIILNVYTHIFDYNYSIKRKRYWFKKYLNYKNL